MGKTQESRETIDKAIAHPTASANMIYQYGKSLLDAGRNEEALRIFNLNKQKFPKDNFTPNVGLHALTQHLVIRRTRSVIGKPKLKIYLLIKKESEVLKG